MSTLRNLRKLDRNLRHRILKLPWFDVQPTDCLVASWPRSGNTWMRHLLFHIRYPKDSLSMERLDSLMPEMDHLGFRKRLVALEHEPLRIIKTHEEGRRGYLKGKVLVIVRDGRDATLSWHHMRENLHDASADFSTFLKRCLRGRVTYGSWHKNVESWLQFKGHPSVLFVRYEDMLADVKRVLIQTLEHFGIPATDQQIADAIEKSQVKHVNKTFGAFVRKKSKQPFSGGLGGGSERWRSQYSTDDLRRFISHAGPTLRRLGYAVDD